MKLILKVLVINILVTGTVAFCYSQNCSPQLNLPKECHTVEGKVYSSSDKKYDLKRASLLLFLLGKPRGCLKSQKTIKSVNEAKDLFN